MSQFFKIHVLRTLAFCLCVAGAFAGYGRAVNYSPPQALNDYATQDNGADEVRPEIATDSNGNWVAIWVSYSGLYSAKSIDMGNTWSAPVLLNGSLDPSRSISSVAVEYAGSGKWLIVWLITPINLFGPGSETVVVYSTTSTDGASWSEPNVVLNNIGSRRSFDMDSDGDGTFIITRGTNLIRSSDYGQTWTTSDVDFATDDAVYIENAHIASAGNGKWFHIVYDDYSAVSYIYASVDGGATWTAPRVQNIGGVYDLAASGNKLIVANPPSVGVSNDGGITWTDSPNSYGNPKRQVELALDDEGNAQMVVQTRAPRNFETYDISITRAASPTTAWSPMQTIAAELDRNETNPAIAADGNGGLVVVYDVFAQETILGPDSDIKSVHSLDGGVSWSTPVYVNEGAADDLPVIQDTEVQLQSGDNGTVVAVWGAETSKDPFLDLVMWARSGDYGRTWSNTAIVSPWYSNLSQITKPRLYYSGNGRWLARWDTLGNRFQGFYAVSDDDGFSWSERRIFYGYTAGASGNGTMVKGHAAGGEPYQYGFARLPHGALYWEEPFHITGKINSIHHSSGPNWFSFTDDLKTYVSPDDGRTWSELQGSNTPPVYALITSDHNGTIVAMFPKQINVNNELPIYTSRSTDNGITWSAPGLALGTANFYANLDWGDLVAAGEGKWVAVWHTGSGAAGLRAYSSISRDNGLTWSAPTQAIPDAQVSPFWQMSPAVAASNSKVIISWNNERINSYVPSSPESLGTDSDIHYSYGQIEKEKPNAASDWQLYQ